MSLAECIFDNMAL